MPKRPPPRAEDVQRLLDDREAQGLPRVVSDPVALARIGAIIGPVAAKAQRREAA